MSMQQFCFGLAKMSYLLLMACKDVIFIMFIKWKLIPIGRSQYYKLYCLIISVAILKNIWFYNILSCQNCVHIPTHLQAFINVLLTSLQELYKITVFNNICGLTKYSTIFVFIFATHLSQAQLVDKWWDIHVQISIL